MGLGFDCLLSMGLRLRLLFVMCLWCLVVRQNCVVGCVDVWLVVVRLLRLIVIFIFAWFNSISYLSSWFCFLYIISLMVWGL